MIDWRTVYPSVEAIGLANLDTLAAWDKHLPAPRTDVERTVRRRLKARLDAETRAQVREKAPEIATAMNDIIDRLEKLGIKSPVERF